MSNLMIVDLSSGSGGSARGIPGLVNAAKKAGLNPVVYCRNPSPSIHSIAIQGYPIIRENFPEASNNKSTKLKSIGARLIKRCLGPHKSELLSKGRYIHIIRSAIIESSIDVVHCNCEPNTDIAFIAAAARQGTRIISHVRSAEFVLSRQRTRFLNSLHIHWVAASRRVAETLRSNGITTDAITILHNGVPLQRTTIPRPPLKHRWSNEQVNIVNVGRLAEIKRHDVGLLAIHQLLSQDPTIKDRIKLWVVGSGPEEKSLTHLARSLGIESNVNFTGQVPNAVAIIEQADLFVTTSRTEACCRAILEAMSTSRAIIASDVGGNSELIQNEESGLLYDFGDHATLAAMMSALINDPKKRQRLGQAAFRRVAEHFSEDVFESRMMTIYKEIRPK